ncbi:MAG: EamA family transporter [Chromatiaceae bacterium]|nr:EamA family transporter [Gammaproteobacteria bacterium]MCP5428280.1 EamA family transporter [Chromatiaceae bacterium]MCP5448800.1 EamA family transporter [Chromatiaceae bacterium]
MNEKFDFYGHFYIMLTLFFTVYGQLVLKWQISQVGSLPEGGINKIFFLLIQFLNPWIISGFFSAFLASLAWMAAMTRFDLNYAYPFMSLAFIIVMGFSVLFLNESLTLQRVLGTALVVAGLIVVARA